MALDVKNYKTAYFIRDYIATAVDYGYYRNLNDEFPKATVVLFVDMGAVATTATLVRYSKVGVLIAFHSIEQNGDFGN